MSTPSMFDHVTLKVRDLDASVRFYDAALDTLGHTKVSHDASGAGFGSKEAAALWLIPGDGAATRGTHVAFVARDHAAVDRFYAAGLAAGGRDNGRPGPRTDYGPSYYAAFLLDPDGNNIEAVCLT